MAYRALDKYIAEDFEDPVNRRMEFLRNLIFKDCSHAGVISTNHNLCSEIVSRIGDLNGKGVLVWFNPEFLFLIRDKFPKARIWFVTGGATATRMGVSGQFGESIEEVIMVDPYNFESVKAQMKRINMKFDVVVGNPPYQSEKGTGTQPLWPLFVYESFKRLKDTGILAMITPNKWCGHTANVRKGDVRLYSDCFLGKLKFANIQECSKYFDVGSYEDSFSYFVVENKGTEYSILQTPAGVFKVDSKYPFLPIGYQEPITFSILEKLQNAGSYGFRQVSTGFKNKGTGEIVISMAQRLHYDKLEIYLDDDPSRKSTSKSTVSTKKFTNSDQEKIRKIFRSKLYRFLHHIYWNGDNFSTTFYNSLPYLDPSIDWEDDKIFKFFNLTEDEVNHIEKLIRSL